MRVEGGTVKARVKLEELHIKLTHWIENLTEVCAVRIGKKI